jgi:hypothetical protein
VELKNVLDGLALESLFAMRLKPNSFVEFTQTLEKKIIPLFRIQKGFWGEIMLCYAIFDLYQTRFSLLMEDFAVVVVGAVAVVLLSVFAVWLLTTVLSIILLPIYLLGVLRSVIEASGNSEDCAALAKASLEGEQGRGASRRALSRPRFGATFLRHLVNSPREMQGREV